MMSSDPRFANNPMLQQSLRALQSNPEMINQVSRMMSDPNNGMDRMMADMMHYHGGLDGANTSSSSSGAGSTTGVDPFAGGPESMRRLMEQFQQNSQQFGGSSGGSAFGAGGHSSAGAASSGSSGNANNANNNNGSLDENTTNNDAEMTEEEMIAEAIARSLRDP